MSGAHDVAPGETLASIAGAMVSILGACRLQRLADIDTLHAGQRLRIPVTDAGSDPTAKR